MYEDSVANWRRRELLGALVAGGGLAALPQAAQAQAYPSKPIKMAVLSPPGANGDLLARLLGRHLESELGQPVIIENKPGVGGNIGAEQVAKASADGYTLLVTLTSFLPSSSVLYSKLRFDPENDFLNVSEVAMMNAAWVVNASLPIHNVKDLIEYSKANPEKATMGSLGPGTTGHIAQHILNSRYGAKLTQVPYKGEAPKVQDLLAGTIDSAIVAGVHVRNHAASGKLRCIGIGGSRRSTVAPEVLTLGEQGFKDSEWSYEGPYAVFAPKDIDPAILNKLGAVFKKAAQSEKTVQFLKEGGIYPHGNTPAEAQANFKKYYAMVKASVAATGARID